tara:strand:+ start:323 stop:682 length:360 start_codon:yes stop_codon:yes gene_type:complete
MKQGRTEKAVFAKLSTEKVELAKINELESLVKEARSVEADMVDFFREAKSISKRGVQAAEKHLQNIKQISNLSTDIKNASKELGIDVSKVQEYKKAFNFLNSNPKSATEVMIRKMQSLL